MSSKLISYAIALVLISSCSSKKTEESHDELGKVTMANAKDTKDNSTFTLNSNYGESCKNNADTGKLDAVIYNTSGGPNLKLQIKGFKTTAATYTCTQTDTNRTQGSVGDKYDVCAVDAIIPYDSTGGSGKLNSYAMYRDASDTKSFTYAGACTIQITKGSGTLEGTVSCTKMIRTMLEGAQPNPFDATQTADLSATFKCPM